jgi:hypothetical protein
MVLAGYFRWVWVFIILALFFGYLLWSCLWTVCSWRCLKVEQSSDQATDLFAGDSVCLRHTLKNNGSLPLARCGLRFYLPAVFTPGQAENLTLSKDDPLEDVHQEAERFLPMSWLRAEAQRMWLAANACVDVKLTVTAPLRGYYCLPPAQTFAGDPSGLYLRFSPVGQARFLHVLPVPKQGAELFKVLSFEQNHREDLFGLDDRDQAVGVRDYQSSDSLKQINWYATARTQSVKANVYQRKISSSCLVVLDLCCSQQPAVEPWMERSADPLFEEAVSLACGIALSQLERGAKTAFMTNAPMLRWDRQTEKTPPGAPGALPRRNRRISVADYGEGDEQARRILELCAEIDDTARASPFQQEQLWARAAERSGNKVVYLVCYHAPSPAWRRLLTPEEKLELADPADFYTPGRLAALSASRLQRIDLSKGLPTDADTP